ncbi:hypothetical protein [Thermomonospora catenispora]|uniref:hypothetical protein n=1 Tax=Thermomonospora catenispora TaxID=2493090 RepID=UPI001588A91D|nr:hypothetical protein [Thermomonospora catenispora]
MSRRLQVVWEPGSDLLIGVCHCGAESRAADPVEIWHWLLSHPDHPSPRTEHEH